VVARGDPERGRGGGAGLVALDLPYDRTRVTARQEPGYRAGCRGNRPGCTVGAVFSREVERVGFGVAQLVVEGPGSVYLGVCGAGDRRRRHLVVVQVEGDLVAGADFHGVIGWGDAEPHVRDILAGQVGGGVPRETSRVIRRYYVLSVGAGSGPVPGVPDVGGELGDQPDEVAFAVGDSVADRDVSGDLFGDVVDHDGRVVVAVIGHELAGSGGRGVPVPVGYIARLDGDLVEGQVLAGIQVCLEAVPGIDVEVEAVIRTVPIQVAEIDLPVNDGACPVIAY